jgi:hypothetical protein
MYNTRRALFTLLGVAGAGALIWAATKVDDHTTGGYWTAYGLLAAAGLVLALAQVLGGWTKGGPLRVSPAVFLVAFVPALIGVGWVVAAGQPVNTVSSHVLEWSRDLHANGLVNDLREYLGPLAMLLGLTLGFTFDTARSRRVIDERSSEPAVADAPLTRERLAAPTAVTTASDADADSRTAATQVKTPRAGEPTVRR